MFLSNLSIKRPVLATVMMLTLVTLGIFSYRQLAIDQFPDVEIPILSVITVYPGAAPESVEREVSKPIEEAVNPIAGVKYVNSISREGVSQVWVEFELGVDIDDVGQEARSKIGAIRGDLPREIEEPIVQKLDFAAMPIISLAVRSDAMSPRDLTTLVEKKVQRRIENISGVGKVDLVGPATREVNVDLKTDRLEALGMGVDEVIGGLRSENVNTPLGRLDRGTTEVPLRISGKPAQVAGFADMVIADRDGRPVTLGEVADVRDGVEEQRSLALIDGVPAIALDVLKQSGANTVKVVDAVKREIARLQAEMPAGTSIEMVRDGSVWIRDSVRDVQETLVLGGILTVLIVFLFLNSWRSTVITGLTLPISVISSFIAMNFLGMTLNVMTLMALSLAIGLLIDDAIVVRENIVRHLEQGEDHFTAAANGTSEIGLAVLATTMSIIAVFVPVAFMKGIVGKFFFEFGMTVAFAVLVSLFVSFTLDPMLSSRWVDPDIERTGRRNPLSRALDRFNAAFDRAADGYRGVIGWALDHRKTVVAGATAAFVAGLVVFGMLQSEFFPISDQGEFQINVTAAPDASIDETRGRIEAIVGVLGDEPEVERTYASIGAGDTGTVREGSVYVKLVDRAERDRSQKEIQREVRARLALIPGITVAFAEPGNLDTRKMVEASVRGEDIDTLKAIATKLKDRMYGVPGLVDLEMSLEQETPEYRLVVDRERASDLGVRTSQVAGAVSALVGGQAVTTYEDEDGDAVDVRVRLPEEARQGIEQVAALRLAVPRPGDAPALVPIGDVTRHERSTTPSEVVRRDLSREVVVSANLDDLPLGTAVQKVEEIAAGLDMPPGYRVVMAGQSEEMDESFGYLGDALLLAVIMVYLILAAQFESFIDPLAIMLSLPLSIVGMAGMLLATGDTISIMSLIGLIMLMGLVTKNAILLVDYTKVLRREHGMDRREALITAGRTRLRPIMMTTLAMIFGMLPLALAMGAGGEMRAPMARAVIGGLITSTLLTLLVVPVVYSILDDFGAWVLRRRAAPAHAPAAVAGKAAALGVVLALLVAPLAVAQQGGVQPAADDGGAPLVLTLDEALAIADERNPDILKAIEYGRWGHGRYVEERAAALPKLTFSADGTRQHDESQRALFGEFADLIPVEQDISVTQVGLSQALFTWGQVGAAVRAAKYLLATADDRERLQRQAVRRDVTAAFYDVLLAREMSAIAQQNLEQKERHLTEARHKYDAGTATDYDVLAAEVAVANARPDVVRTANAVQTARANLKFILASDREVDVVGELATPESVRAVTYDEALATALASRPELAEIEHQRLAQEQVVKIAKAGDKPRLDLQAAYGWQWISAGPIDADGKTWRAGVYLSFPFFDGLKTSGKVAQARSDLRTLELNQGQLRDSIALQVRTAVNAVEESARIIEGLEGTVEQAKKLLWMAEQGFEYGVKTRLDVEDAQLNLSAAEGNLATARRDYIVALTTLRWVQGVLGGAN